MNNSSIANVFSIGRTAWRRRGAARLIAAAIALLTFTAAHAQPLTPQQLTVAAANAYGNSVYGLTLNGPIINGAQSINSDGASHGIFDALVWVPNSFTGTRDLIVADAKKGQIVRYSGPNYGTSTALFAWTRRGAGPAHPVGLTVDGAGNVYVVSPSCDWDATPSLWVLPFNAATGVYGAPVLIDHTFGGTKTLALAEVQIAGTPATPVGAAAPAWNAGDLLVLVGDTFNARVIVYSQAAINGVIANPNVPLIGPTSTAVTRAQFLKLLAVPFGMDVWPADATHGVSLLFTTIDGRVLRFDSSQNKFVANFAGGLGFGLQKLKVGSYSNVPYAFVAKVTLPSSGQILQFGAPPASGANAPIATVSNGVSDPVGLAVTSSGSVLASSCIAPNTCTPLGTGLTLQISGPDAGNIPPGATILEEICLVQNDPRVTVDGEGGWSCLGPQINVCNGDVTTNCVPPTLDVANFCPNFPHTVLPEHLCGHSGATGSAFAVVKATAVAVDQNANNTFMQTDADTTQFLPGPYDLACPQGPKFAWAPRSDLPTVEGVIVEDQFLANTFIDLTGLCDGGGGNHHLASMISFGLGLNTNPFGEGGLFAFVSDKFFNLTNMITSVSAQISGGAGGVVATTLQNSIAQSQSYFNNAQYNCALNTIASTDSFLRANTNDNTFSFAQPPAGNANPAGEIDGRLANLFLTIATYFAGLPSNTTWPTNSVPACAPTLSFIVVIPDQQSVLLGNTQQYAAAGHYSDLSTQDLTNTASWSSSNANVATVSASGLATCVTVGNTMISATGANNVTGSVTLICYNIG